MRDPLIVCAIACFTLGGVLGVAMFAPDAAVLEFDPLRPATLVPIIAAGVHEVYRFARDWAETTVGDLRDVLQRTKLREALPQ